MADFPSTPTPGKLGDFLGHIQQAGVPSKVSQTYLKSAGFKSSNDRYMPGVFKVLGFVDASGAPTDRWRAYKDRSRAGSVLAAALRETYRGLYETYPDAHNRPTSSLRDFMAAHSGASDVVVQRMVGTFKQLAKKADFGADSAAAWVDDLAGDGQSDYAPPTQAAVPTSARAAPRPSPLDGAQRFEADGVLIEIIPTKKNIEKAKKILEVIELDVDEE